MFDANPTQTLGHRNLEDADNSDTQQPHYFDCASCVLRRNAIHKTNLRELLRDFDMLNLWVANLPFLRSAGGIRKSPLDTQGLERLSFRIRYHNCEHYPDIVFRYNTRSNKVRVVKTPGGKLRYQHIKKKGSAPKCGDCGIKLPGVSLPNISEQQARDLGMRDGVGIERAYTAFYWVVN